MPQQKINLFGQFKGPGLDTSKADTARVLAGLAGQASDMALSIGNKKMTKQGAIEGAQQAQSDFKSGAKLEKDNSFFGAYRENYNSSAISAYAADVDNDSREKLDQYANEHSTDLKSFSLLAESYKQATLSNVDEETQLILGASLDSKISQYSTQIKESERQKILTDNDNKHQIGITNFTNDALSQAFDGNFQAASDALGVANRLLEERLLSGKISTVEFQKQTAALQDSVDVEANRFVFGEMLKKNDIVKMIDFTQKLSDEKIKGKTPEQHRNLLNIINSDMNNYYSASDKKETVLKEQLEAKQKGVSGELFFGITDGSIGLSKIQAAFNVGAIDGDQYKLLTNKLNTSGQGVDDYELILDIKQETDPEMAIKRIQENMGTKLTGSTAASLITSVKKNADETSPLNTTIAKRYKKLLMKTVNIQPSAFITDPEVSKRAAQIEVVFEERVDAGEDPTVVAKELMEANENIDYSPPVGTVDNIDAAIQEYKAEFERQINLPAKKKTITKEEFIRQLNDMEYFKKHQSAVNNFKKAFGDL
jgi:hypothetical protein